MAKYLDGSGLSQVWTKAKNTFSPLSHSHNYLPLSGGTLSGTLNTGGGTLLYSRTKYIFYS